MPALKSIPPPSQEMPLMHGAYPGKWNKTTPSSSSDGPKTLVGPLLSVTMAKEASHGVLKCPGCPHELVLFQSQSVTLDG
jgi:hypothetical protein